MSDYAKRILLALFSALALCACGQSDAKTQQVPDAASTVSASVAAPANPTGNALIEQAFKARKSNVQAGGQGMVIKLLKDDNKGARHQKFLVKINARQTLLFAHNIDLAPRVPLEIGDEISFYGEYIYNPKGGVMHWTHQAPRGDHEAGWILYKSKKYQ